MTFDIIETFRSMDKEGIDYFIMRDFLPIENLRKSMDIDVYVNPKDRLRVKKKLLKEGWFLQKLNTSRYPHEQYICFKNNHYYKLDIVYGLYYSDRLYHFCFENLLVNKYRKLNGVRVACPYIAMILFVLHIIYDKECLTDKNLQILLKMMTNIQDSNTEFKELYHDHFENVVKLFLQNECDFKVLNNKFLKNKIVEYSIKRYWIHRIITKGNNVLRSIYKKISNNTICFVGIDGSGKSTTVENLQKILPNFIHLQYMGFKDYQTNSCKKITAIKNKNAIQKILEILYIYFDMVYRYVSVRFKTGIVVYDRYVWEAYYNNVKIRKVIYFILYKILFPKPKLIIYLHCPSKISLQRKNDIEDVELFMKMKKKTDEIYLNMNKVIDFNSYELTQEEILEKVCEVINNKFIKYLI